MAYHWLSRLVTAMESEVFHIDLLSTSTDMFDVWFRIEGDPSSLLVWQPLGERIKIRSGPFSRRWADLIAEIADNAAIDVVLWLTE